MFLYALSATYTIVEEEDSFEYILDNKELHNFALQIANGMRFLEQQEITHRYAQKQYISKFKFPRM